MNTYTSMMTRTSIQALVAFTSLTLISAMPFLGAADDLKKFSDRDGSLLNPASSDTSAEIDIYPPGDATDGLYSSDVIYKLILQNLDQIKNRGVQGGERGKRFGFGRPYVRLTTDNKGRPFARLLPEIGKRQEFGNYFMNGDRDLYESQVSPEVTKRRGFTALRGRR